MNIYNSYSKLEMTLLYGRYKFSIYSANIIGASIFICKNLII